MLKKFVLENYRNFRGKIEIDFADVAGYQYSTDCISSGLITKMIIYGRNATGKTNFGKAILDIVSIFYRMSRFQNASNYLNADSKKDSSNFSYFFAFHGVEVNYNYARFSNQDLKEEELIIDGISIFKCDYVNKDFNFVNLKHVKAETAITERFLQAIEPVEALKEDNEYSENGVPFLRWLINNVALNKYSIIMRLAEYVGKMKLVNVGESMRIRLTRGLVNSSLFENPQRVSDLELFLNDMGIECKLVLRKLPDGQKQLYFKHEKFVPFFENASSGTKALFDLYYRVVSRSMDASFIYLDEFDAFYHYEMAENVIKFFKRRYPQTQIIMTSHNTNLMQNRLMRPDCLFILSREGSLTALCKATKRELREGHNLEKMYISGEFDKYE